MTGELLREDAEDRRMRVLVVEDQPAAAWALAQFLQNSGHEAEVAADGPAAVAAATAHPPDVVLLDIGLPGMDGWQVAQQLHDMNVPKRPLLVALTGRSEEQDLIRSEEAGIDLHLSKPADAGQLRAFLSRFRSFLSQ